MQLPAGYLRSLADYEYSRYFVQLPPGYGYEDMFQPVFWAHHQRLKKFDIIRVVAHDWSFDVEITVTAKTKGGANVQLHPLLPADPGEIAVHYVKKLKNGKMAVRVEYLKATKWRVIALDQSEHSRDYETEAEATGAMHQYLKELGMAFPPDVDRDDEAELERLTSPTKAVA
jgi:hypothetical protein